MALTNQDIVNAYYNPDFDRRAPGLIDKRKLCELCETKMPQGGCRLNGTCDSYSSFRLRGGAPMPHETLDQAVLRAEQTPKT
jgi:hypothetical protein